MCKIKKKQKAVSIKIPYDIIALSNVPEEELIRDARIRNLHSMADEMFPISTFKITTTVTYNKTLRVVEVKTIATYNPEDTFDSELEEVTYES